MDWNSIVGYAPVAVGTIALGLVTNRLDRFVDYVRGKSTASRQAKFAHRRQLEEDLASKIVADNYVSSYFIVQIAWTSKDFFVGLITISLGLAPILLIKSSDFIVTGIIWFAVEIFGFYYYIKGLNGFRRYLRLYRAVVRHGKKSTPTHTP